MLGLTLNFGLAGAYIVYCDMVGYKFPVVLIAGMHVAIACISMRRNRSDDDGGVAH